MRQPTRSLEPLKSSLWHKPIKHGYQHMLYSRNHIVIIIYTLVLFFMLFYSALAKSILIIVVCTLEFWDSFIFALHYLCLCALLLQAIKLCWRRKYIFTWLHSHMFVYFYSIYFIIINIIIGIIIIIYPCPSPTQDLSSLLFIEFKWY